MHFSETEETFILARSGLLHDVVSADNLLLIKAKYQEAGRHYHNWTHALSVLSWVNHVCEKYSEYELRPYTHLDLQLAALFHDVVYTTQGSPQNETDSVYFLKMMGIPDVDRVCEIIMATAKHGKLERNDVPLAIALFMDCDIASFGETRWEVSVWNDENIVKEFLQKYTLEQIKHGRKAFLKGMLEKKDIFLSRHFSQRFERQARENIKRLIQNLDNID